MIQSFSYLFLSFVFLLPYTMSANQTSSGSKNDEASLRADVFQDIQKQKNELAERDKKLKDFEKELKLREEAIAQELKKLEALRAEIDQSQSTRKAQDQESVERLTSSVFRMSPKDSAKLLVELDRGLAVQVMKNIQPERMAKIYQKMDPKDAATLSELLVGIKPKERSKSTSEGGES